MLSLKCIAWGCVLAVMKLPAMFKLCGWSARYRQFEKIISSDLEYYVLKDKMVVEGLKRFVTHGKKIFILINSDYFYSKTLLDYAITPFLKAGEQWSESYFAYQVDRFACIYMEKLSDLLEHSPLTYLRSNRRSLAHDISF